MERDHRALADEWLGRELKPLTAKSYANGLRLWFTWCAGHGIDPLDCTCTDACRWRDELLGRFAKTSVRAALTAASTFSKWLVAEGHAVRNPFDTVKRPAQDPKAPKRWIEAAEIARFCQAAAAESDMSLAAAVLTARRGLRASEALAASWDDMTLSGSRRTLTLHDTKTGSRDVHLTAGDTRRLNRLTHRSGTFLRQDNGEMWPARRLERWAQRTARAARIDHPEQVTPHVLRRSVAMFWLEQFNGNIWTVSQMLGHKDIRTTAAYLKAKFEADDPSPDQADSALDMLEDAAFEAATATQVASELWSDLPIPLLKPLPEAG